MAALSIILQSLIVRSSILTMAPPFPVTSPPVSVNPLIETLAVPGALM
jgi:hypothetical protein